jgi:SAM-dependent methyltransferase
VKKLIEYENLVSRFITKSDNHTSQFIFPLPEHWTSRPYEYPWAALFAGAEDVVLDAACGLSHPLKFYLANNCRDVYAIDNDSAISSPHLIRKAISEDFHYDIEKVFEDQFFNKIKFLRCDITNLPFNEKTFDKIFCISVLEHLDDYCNAHSLFMHLPFLHRFFPSDIRKALSEFKRVLKPNGLVILTFDYPIINLNYFSNLISKIGYEFAGDYDFVIPKNALYSKKYKLYFFRACLKIKSKKSKSEIITLKNTEFANRHFGIIKK